MEVFPVKSWLLCLVKESKLETWCGQYLKNKGWFIDVALASHLTQLGKFTLILSYFAVACIYTEADMCPLSKHILTRLEHIQFNIQHSILPHRKCQTKWRRDSEDMSTCWWVHLNFSTNIWYRGKVQWWDTILFKLYIICP